MTDNNTSWFWHEVKTREKGLSANRCQINKHATVWQSYKGDIGNKKMVDKSNSTYNFSNS